MYYAGNLIPPHSVIQPALPLKLCCALELVFACRHLLLIPLVQYAAILQNTESSSCETAASQQTTEGQDDLILPKKLSNPVLECSCRRRLHRELLVSHRCGLLPVEKPELKRVLEQRRLEQHREREQASQPPSDLEQELHKRRQKLMAVRVHWCTRGRQFNQRRPLLLCRDEERISVIHFTVSGHEDLSEFDKGQIVMARRLGQSITKTAALVGCSRTLTGSVILSLQYEQEELRHRENIRNMPEFVRVRENLRHITITGY
ncbi:Protein FAM107B [Anabarilius grahami]|uniref:Protein FAM107B n=1 Tax=Anabarilius grahami TaxID=495550 RepID=A0A3N0XU23_ANAGA|nr:Protein FAM107B [Anabarilius grahami]